MMIQIWPCPVNGLLWVVYPCWGFAWWEKTSAGVAARRVYLLWCATAATVLSSRLQCHTSKVMLEWKRNTFTSHCYQGTQWNVALKTRERESKTSGTQHSEDIGLQWVALPGLSPLLDEDCGLISRRGSRQFRVVLHKRQLARDI